MQYLLSLFVALLAFSTSKSQTTEEQAIKQSFEKYKAAIIAGKGNEAVNYVDNRTINYYSSILDHVRTSDSARVDSLSIMDKLMVFSVRHRATKEDIKSFTGKSLLVYAINSGMVGKSSVSSSSIGEVSVENNFAKGQFVNNGNPLPFYFHFNKEAGEWKIDLTALFPLSTRSFEKLVNESGQNENEFLFSLLEMVTQRKPGPEIWLAVQ